MIDSGPSKDAIDVLESIPEPLRPSERTTAPSPQAIPIDTTAAPTESGTAADSTADANGADAPIPEPTLPLGQRPPPSADSSASAGASAQAPATQPLPEAPPPSRAPSETKPTSRGGLAAPAAGDTCWRVQLGAPPERKEADQVRQAAESLLLMPMVVESEKRRFKVRTRDCLDAATADRLKARAVAAGFSGAFRFPGHRP